MARHRPLTDREVAGLKPGEATYAVADGTVRGLQIRVTPGGAKTWCLLYRQRVLVPATGQWIGRGPVRRWTIGRYPAVTAAVAHRPPLRGVDDGVSTRVDELRAYGNAVVPAQGAYALRLLLQRRRAEGV